MFEFEFDATNFNPLDKGDSSPLPAGEYLCEITESEMRDTRAGNGQYCQMRFKVLDGNYKGRVIFHRLNLINPNPKAVEVAESQLAHICHATGMLKIKDIEELHNIPVVCEVKLGQEYNGKIPNEIKRVWKYRGEQPPPSADNNAGGKLNDIPY